MHFSSPQEMAVCSNSSKEVTEPPELKCHMKLVRPQVMYLAAIIVILSLTLWVAFLFFGYLADDWHAPAADEKSVPASREY
jgi:hypothetical protein